MGAAIVLLLTLTFSVVVVRTAAVALRHTGMPADVARFQARSAFTGTGFTTSETEAVVSHPVRRRVIGFLMLFGNIGLVTVLATFIVSFVATDNSIAAFSRQVFWLLGALALLWFLALNPMADRLMCKSIGWLLRKTTSLSQQCPSNAHEITSPKFPLPTAGERGRVRGKCGSYFVSVPTALLQITSGHSVSEHAVLTGNGFAQKSLSELSNGQATLLILGIEHGDGSYSSVPEPSTRLKAGDRVIVYGSEEEHRAVHGSRCDTRTIRDVPNPDHR